MAKAKANTKKTVETFLHDEATRKNIPTAEYESVMYEADKTPVRLAYERRNRDLDPQLVWRGKDEQDWSDLVVQAPPLYIQEKVHPKVLIDDLLRRTERAEEKEEIQHALFADLYSAFNGLDEAAKTDFYQHDQNWSNRMILGDSLQVMASLAEREGLRGKVQCIYFDPPYGIKFNSNFQWSTTSRDVKDGNAEHITREPEQVKAFRDTWRDGIHSYLTYLRDRLTVARDLLTESGSIFVQIGDENVHRVRALMDEVFGDENAISQIPFIKTSSKGEAYLDTIHDYLLWYARDKEKLKYRQPYIERSKKSLDSGYGWIESNLTERRLSADEKEDETLDGDRFATSALISQSGGEKTSFPVACRGSKYLPSANSFWKTNELGMSRLTKANRLVPVKQTLNYKRFAKDFPAVAMTSWWGDTKESTFATNKIYVVQTYTKVVERCILMTTDPGDLVLDPTCGSGTTAYVAEQWGRRWITIDTSRVALALARARIMGARYPYYLLADSEQGKRKEWELRGTTGGNPNGSEGVNGGEETPSLQVGFQPTYNNIRHGFVYERVPHITLKSIANNTEIDVIYDKWQETLEPLREEINKALGKNWQEWEVPRELATEHTEGTEAERNDSLRSQCSLWLKSWWEARIARQKEIDASIAAKAEFEYLYDKPYDDKKKVRVAGPFTVESLSPHRTLGMDENDELIDPMRPRRENHPADEASAPLLRKEGSFGARGYICENYGSHFRLPELGPIGANCLANARDFETPVAWFEDKEGECEIVAKFGGQLWSCTSGHSPLDVVAWHGNNVLYRYDLRRFNTIGSISYDHPDPCIFTVLTSPSGEPGVANCDFAIFPDRWLVGEDTFRPPWYHRNTMSEYMGLVYGQYDAKEEGFVPGGGSLHNQMSAHGPDLDAFEKASNAELKPQKLEGTMAFMFESRYIIRPTRFAMETSKLQHEYSEVWQGLKKNFHK